MQNKAVIYLRGDALQEQAVIAAQREVCETFCRQQNMKVVGTYIETLLDLGRGDQPQLSALQDVVREGRANIIIVYSLSQLATTSDDLITLCHELEIDGGCVYSQATLVNSTGAKSEAITTMLQEREQASLVLQQLAAMWQ